MKVKLKKLNENTRMPEEGKHGDFCYDVWAVSEEELAVTEDLMSRLPQSLMNEFLDDETINYLKQKAYEE